MLTRTDRKRNELRNKKITERMLWSLSLIVLISYCMIAN